MSDELSQDPPDEKVQFALIVKNFFDSAKGDYKKDADQRNRDDDVLESQGGCCLLGFRLEATRPGD